MEDGMKEATHTGQKFGLIVVLLAGCIMLVPFAILLNKWAMYAVPSVANPTPDILETRLTSALSSYEHGKSSVIDLSAATSFSWDRLYVFVPYTPLEQLESTVGRSWRKVCFTHIDVLEGVSLLVFTQKGKVVHCLEYSVETYDFSPLAKYESGISIQDALFVLDDSGSLVLANGK
jgi:hypothetical protein